MYPVNLMQETKQYKGVKLASGQDIFSQHLVMEPSSLFPSSVPSTLGHEGLDASKVNAKVARGICITSSSLQQDLSNIMVIFPPRCKNCTFFSYDHASTLITFMPNS